MNNIINVSSHLTSAVFYNVLLNRINFFKRYHRNSNPIILDFFETKKIEPLVIPNLLCIGESILRETGTKMVIRIPETLQAGKLKFYMKEIGFIKYANNAIYAFESSPYNGMEGKTIDPLCGSMHFEADLTRGQIRNGINGYVAPFTNEYLKQYIEYSEEDEIYVNKIDHFLFEIIDNCRIHGRSDSFMTIHARYQDRKIYIAASDTGLGFLNSWNKKEKDDDDFNIESNLLGRKPETELEAILCGVYKRKQSKIYGLYNIIVQTINLQGIVRIHSNNTRVIFTPNLCKNNAIEMPRLFLENNEVKKWNVNINYRFKGAHIEMEIPF